VSKHAIWSPSSSPYWYNWGEGCTARVLLPAKPETSSPAAEEGTRLHGVAEDLLLREVKVAPADWEKIRPYVEYVQQYDLNPKLTTTIEVRVNLEPVTGEKGAAGTVDALVCGDDYLEVIDLKTGSQAVSPMSSQLLMYAYATVLEVDYQGAEVVCTIVQGDEVKSHTYELSELLEMGRSIRNYVDRHRYERVYRPSNKNCQWCPHAVDCTALVEYRDEVAASEFAVPEDPDLLAKALLMVGPMKQHLEAVQAKATSAMVSGIQLEGCKLVRSSTRRKWTDDAEAKLVASLGDAAYDRKLIGLTKADKLVDAETMEQLTYVDEGRPVAVPASDRRKEYHGDAATDFND